MKGINKCMDWESKWEQRKDLNCENVVIFCGLIEIRQLVNHLHPFVRLIEIRWFVDAVMPVRKSVENDTYELIATNYVCRVQTEKFN